MSPTTASIAIATCGLFGGALGYLVGQGPPERGRPETERSAIAEADETESAEGWSPTVLTAPVEPQSLGGEAATALQAGLEALENEGGFAALISVATIEDPVARRDAFMELIARLDAEQLREIVFGLESALTSGDKAAMAQLEPLFDDFGDALMLFDRWAELDAAGVREFVSAPTAGDSDDEFILFRAISLAFLARRDPDGAKAIAEAALGQDAYANFGMELQSILAFGIGLGDPARGVREMLADEDRSGPDLDDMFEAVGARSGQALPEVLALAPGEVREEALHDLFEAWAGAAPHEALAAAQGLESVEERESATYRVLEEMAEADPVAAIAAARGVVSGEDLDEVYLEIGQEWAGRDPVAALSWATETLDDVQVATILDREEDTIPAALAMETISNLSPEGRERVLRGVDFGDGDNFLQRAAAVDTAGALRWLNEMGVAEASAELGDSLGTRAASLGREHLDEALALVPEGQFQTDFVRSAAGELAHDDPQGALSWADGLGGEAGDVARSQAFEVWADSDPQAALAYLGASGAAAGSDPYQQIVLNNWAASDPSTTYRWIHEQSQADPEAITATMENASLIEHWVQHDPAAAADAMMGFPEDLAPGHVGRVFEHWSAEEPSRASAYINERLEPGPARDAAVASLVGSIAGDDPEGAANWAATIGDPALRAALLGQ